MAGVVVIPAVVFSAAMGPQLAHFWATLVWLMAPDAAPLAALGLQLTPAGVTLVALQ